MERRDVELDVEDISLNSLIDLTEKAFNIHWNTITIFIS